MNNIWILAAATDTDSEGDLLYGDNVTEQQATQQVIAQDAPNGDAPGQTPQERQKPIIPPWLLIGAMVLIMYMLLFRPKQKQQKQHAQMLQSLKKNDKVRTVGGILGTVSAVNGDEITLKVDESNNTKIKVTSGSISKVLSENNI